MTKTKRDLEIVEVTKYAVGDKLYDTLAEAQEARSKSVSLHDDYILQRCKSHYGWAAGKPFADVANTSGIWRIMDEGPVDFSSSGHRQTLAYVRGTFVAAVKYAMSIPQFKGYGWGEIEPITIKDVP